MTPAIRVFLPPDLVLTRFASATGTPVSELAGPAITRDITRLRHEAMWLMRSLTSAKIEEIGEAFGRSPATTSEGIDKIARRIEVEGHYRERMLALHSAVTDARPAVVIPAACAVIEVRDLHRLMAAKVLADPRLSDRDAKQAALVILSSGMTPAPEIPKGL